MTYNTRIYVFYDSNLSTFEKHWKNYALEAQLP